VFILWLFHDIIVNDSHIFFIILLCVIVLSRENEKFFNYK